MLEARAAAPNMLVDLKRALPSEQCRAAILS
jgi:hypothetical protein